MLKVLVLDDDRDNCLTLEHIVRYAGYDVCSACDTGYFLQLVTNWQPDVLIVDLLLGDTDGISVLATLEQLKVKPAVVVVSGASPRLLEAASRSAIGHGFTVLGTLAKPFNPDALRQLLLKQKPNQPLADAPAQPKPKTLTLDMLQRAFAEQAFYVAYQPKIECRTTTLTGFEALCRLHLADIGEVSPEQFIPLCEQHGLINQLTRCVIDSALPWFATFLQSHRQLASLSNIANVRLAINISALSFEQPDIFDYLTEQCHNWQLTPSSIILELTETSAMADVVRSLDILTRLRLQGFHLSIDDFGTGFSSVLQLVRLPFSELKIDKHFVSSAADSKESRLVISSIIDMAHALGLTVTAEGIEDRRTLSFLQKKHCDTAQGFYIARPLAPDQIDAWVNQHQDDKELARLKALRALDILDSAPEERFDRIIRLAQRIVQVPACTFSLMDQHRIWYKSKVGMPLNEIMRKGSLCELAIAHNGSYCINDTLLHPDTCHNTLVVSAPFIRFYAGHVIAAPNGVVIGSLCFIDFTPRQLSVSQQQALTDLAAMVEEELTTNQRNSLDPLTKLKNRTGFDKRAQSLIKLSQRQQLPLQLVNIKLCFASLELADSFNLFHDRALKDVAQLIKKAFAGADLIARIEENSFNVLFLAQDDSLLSMAIASFHSLMANRSGSKNTTANLQYTLSELHYPQGELMSLQQLYLHLDLNTVSDTPQQTSDVFC